LVPTVAAADQVWTYTGNSVNNFSMNPFLPPAPNPCGCAITAMVDVNSLGQAVTWSFSAAGFTLTNLNSTIQGQLGFAQADPTDMWLFSLIGPNGETIRTFNSGSVTDALDNATTAPGVLALSVGSNAGTWTEVTGTPEPASIVLLAIGMGALMVVAMGRRRAVSLT
jgi:hypothetical protein